MVVAFTVEAVVFAVEVVAVAAFAVKVAALHNLLILLLHLLLRLVHLLLLLLRLLLWLLNLLLRLLHLLLWLLCLLLRLFHLLLRMGSLNMSQHGVFPRERLVAIGTSRPQRVLSVLCGEVGGESVLVREALAAHGAPMPVLPTMSRFMHLTVTPVQKTATAETAAIGEVTRRRRHKLKRKKNQSIMMNVALGHDPAL